MRADGLDHSRHGHRHWHKRFHMINYAELPVGSQHKADAPDPYLAQLHLLYEQQRSLLVKTALLNLLFLLSVIACLWIGATWMLAKYPAPDSPEISPTVTFQHG